MEDTSDLALWLVVWMAAATAVLYGRWKSRSVGAGLVLAYLLHLWLIHWVAASFYLLPWSDFYDFELIETGFKQSAYGVLAFALGSLVLAPIMISHYRVAQRLGTSYSPHPNLPKVYMLIGCISYPLLLSGLGRVPTVNALLAVGQYFFVVGLCLACWKAWQERHRKRLIGWFGVALLLPFITITIQGFIGFGVIAAFAVLAFVASFYRPRWQLVIAGLVLGYVGLSFFGSYMRDRSEIRAAVWGGQPWRDRVERIHETIDTLEWFNPFDNGQLARIDERLNQNHLVGAAISQLATSDAYAHGETIWEAILALIPRAIWPEKPIRAGSGDLVSEYTGYQFAEGTSVGIGQVMEFYINFGSMGVILGFLSMGAIITIIDLTASQRLTSGDWQGFALWYLTGMSFLQVGGSLVEVTGTAGMSIVAALLVNKYLLSHSQRRKSSSVNALTPGLIRELQGQPPTP